MRRWEFLAGKWLGVVLLDAFLLVVIGGVTYGVTLYAAREKPGKRLEWESVRKEVLTSRRPILAPPMIPPEDIHREALRAYEE